MCGGPHKSFECPDRYDLVSKRAKTDVGEAPQRKFEGRVYMMHARSEKAPCSSKSMHMAALDSRATVHIVNS